MRKFINLKNTENEINEPIEIYNHGITHLLPNNDSRYFTYIFKITKKEICNKFKYISMKLLKY